MLASQTSLRLRGERLDCGLPRPAGRRSPLFLAAVTALAAAAAAALPPVGARAQSNQPIPPALQQPLPVQPGQPPAQQPAQQPTQQPPAPQGQAPAEAAETQHGSWVERCTPNPPPEASPPPQGEQNVCFLMQHVIDQNSRQPMLKMTIGFFGPQRQPRAIVAMPLGVPLAKGVQLSVDGKRLGGVPFDVCRRDGCLADVLLDEAVISAFKAGSQAQVRVESDGGEGLDVTISLQGFTAGFSAIQ